MRTRELPAGYEPLPRAEVLRRKRAIAEARLAHAEAVNDAALAAAAREALARIQRWEGESCC